MKNSDSLDSIFVFVALFIFFKDIHKARKSKREKKKLKAEEDRMIALWGENYYRRDKVWNEIKDQKINENYYAWKIRLMRFNFTTEGVDLTSGKQHDAVPVIHSNLPCDNAFQHIKENNKGEKNLWSEILKSYEEKPRNVRTVTQKGSGIWFYVCVENNRLYISAGTKAPASKLKKRTELTEREFNIIMSSYNSDIEYISNEDKHKTFHSSYWYGILSEFEI